MKSTLTAIIYALLTSVPDTTNIHTMSTITTINYAQLEPHCTTPTSAQFGDIYFSPTDGIGESIYHFIEGNNLALRFSKYIQENKHFTIAETGFGTGLNFLLTVKLWQQCQQEYKQLQQSKLHFISTEKYPISKQQLAEIYKAQKWESEITEQLLSTYPDTKDTECKEQKIISIEFDSITLTVLLGDAQEQLQQYQFVADAWFLDGFAPRKNPDMWTQPLFNTMAEKSKTGTTFATFTAASAVRKGLIEAGFTVEKGKGFGRKRERLLGFYP